MTVLEAEASRALAAKRLAQAKLADTVQCPPWRHAVFAALMAAIVLTPALITPLKAAVMIVALVAVIVIVQSDRRRLGVFVNGYRRGKTRRVIFPLLALFFLIYGASEYAAIFVGRPVLSVGLAVVMFATAYAGSVVWQKVFERELRG